MNQKLPYENRISEKLQDLQLPDREMTWQQMKAKLDREMPLSGKGRKGGGGKWWWLSSIIIIISGGVWMFTNTATGDDQTVASDNRENTEFIPSVSANIVASPRTPGMENNKNTSETDGTISDDNHTFDSGNPLTSTSLKDRSTLSPVLSHKSIPVKKVAGTDDREQDRYTAHRETLPATQYSQQNISLVAGHNMEAGNKLPAVASIANEKINMAGASLAAAAYTYNPVHIQNAGYSSRKNVVQPARGNEAGILNVPAYVSTLPDVSAKKKALLRAIKRQENSCKHVRGRISVALPSSVESQALSE